MVARGVKSPGGTSGLALGWLETGVDNDRDLGGGTSIPSGFDVPCDLGIDLHGDRSRR